MKPKQLICLAVILLSATSCIFENRGQMTVLFAIRNQTDEPLAIETNCVSFLQKYNPYISGSSVVSIGEIKVKNSAIIAANTMPAMSNKDFIKQERTILHHNRGFGSEC